VDGCRRAGQPGQHGKRLPWRCLQPNPAAPPCPACPAFTQKSPNHPLAGSLTALGMAQKSCCTRTGCKSSTTLPRLAASSSLCTAAEENSSRYLQGKGGTTRPARGALRRYWGGGTSGGQGEGGSAGEGPRQGNNTCKTAFANRHSSNAGGWRWHSHFKRPRILAVWVMDDLQAARRLLHNPIVCRQSQEQIRAGQATQAIQMVSWPAGAAASCVGHRRRTNTRRRWEHHTIIVSQLLRATPLPTPHLCRRAGTGARACSDPTAA
jgi:hypothetical protein